MATRRRKLLLNEKPRNRLDYNRPSWKAITLTTRCWCNGDFTTVTSGSGRRGQSGAGSAHPPARRGTRARRHYVECHPRGHPRRRKFQATRKFAKTHARVIPAVVSRCSKDVARNIAALCHPATYWLTGSVLQVGGGENIVGWSHDGR